MFVLLIFIKLLLTHTRTFHFLMIGHLLLSFFLLLIIQWLLRIINLAFKSSGFILLVDKHGFKFKYLAFKLPKGQFCVMIILMDMRDVLCQLLFSLNGNNSTSISYLDYFKNLCSPIYIFSLSILYYFEFLTTSSEITISWCCFC